MKILSYRTTFPFENKGPDGSATLSPLTNKSIMPFNNVPTIQDLMEGRQKIEDVYPHAGGDWSSGEDISKSYREKGDDYKRLERDEEILRNMLTPTEKIRQKWEVKVPGGTKAFMSFDLARKYTRENKIPFSYVRRIAQNMNDTEESKVNIIADAISKTFMVESMNIDEGVQDTGSAFCVYPSYFITCAHVIKSYNKNNEVDKSYFSKSIVRLVREGRKYNAYVVGVDPKMDMALLKCNVESGYMEIDAEASIGEDIIAIGSPHGYENNVSTGSIGSDGRKIYFYNGAPDYMFVDLSVFPGNSGGPVIKAANGKIVGMVTLIVSTAGEYGLNAALPSSYIIKFCEDNIKGFYKGV